MSLLLLKMNESTQNDSKLQNISMEDMEELDFSVIEKLPWAQTCYQQLEQHVKKGFLNWCKILNSLAGPKETLMKQWSDSYTQAVDEILCEMVLEVLQKHNATLDNIQELLKRLKTICNELHEPIPQSIGDKGLCLIDEKEHLAQEIEKLQLKLNVKKEDLLKLNEKQLKLCKELGMLPKVTLLYPPLPTPAQVMDIEKNIEEMEAEKFEREEQCCHLKAEIMKYVDEIKFKPSNEFEEMILSTDVHDLPINGENMEKMENFNQQLKNLKTSIEEEMSQLRSRLEDLWKMLETDVSERDEFTSKYTDLSLDSLNALKSEVKRCEDLRKTNIQDIVEKLRRQVEGLWEKCHCSPADKRSFKYFNNDCFTEDLLDLHELEIQKWKVYFEKNGKLLGLLEKHKQLWDKAIELEENASGANRFKNRGGKLLQEERERNKLSKLIPKIEEEIVGLSNEYKEQNGGVLFRTYGRTVEEYIEHVYAERENTRKLKQTVKAPQIDCTPSKKKFTPSTSTTPRPASAIKRNILATPVSANLKRQRLNSGSSTKSTSSTAGSPKKAALATRVLPSQRRKSRGKVEKRKSNSRNKSGTRAMKVPIIQVQNSTYCEFENNAVACSSICPTIVEERSVE